MILVAALPGIAAAQAISVTDVSVETKQTVARAEIVLNAPASYQVFTLANPHRLVVDIEDATWRAEVYGIKKIGGELVKSIRFGRPKEHTLRVVFDLSAPPGKFQHKLNADGEQTNITIDIRGVGARESLSEPTKRMGDAAKQPVVQTPAVLPPQPIRTSRSKAPPPIPEDGEEDEAEAEDDAPEARAPPPAPEPIPVAAKKGAHTGFTQIPTPKPRPTGYLKDLLKPVIVIDAGHGGVDPGAIGQKGTQEHRVTLAYALALRDALNKTGKYKVRLTRESNVYLKLQERVEFARKLNANLFISLHADSAPDPQTRGLSVYTLSEQASDKLAESLAERENQADFLTGIDFKETPKEVTGILIDLAQRETRNKSSVLADTIIHTLPQFGIHLLTNTHRFAGFVVLKNPESPAVLVELGFLSNPKDETLLNSSKYQHQVAQALSKAIEQYFTANPKK